MQPAPPLFEARRSYAHKNVSAKNGSRGSRRPAVALIFVAGASAAGTITVDNTMPASRARASRILTSLRTARSRTPSATRRRAIRFNIANSTYAEYLIIGKDLTLQGASEAGVLIDASSFGGYGIDVSGDYNVTLKQFTLKGPGSAQGYGIKIAGENAQATIQNVTVQEQFSHWN